jgi:hypothetical protein
MLGSLPDLPGNCLGVIDSMFSIIFETSEIECIFIPETVDYEIK